MEFTAFLLLNATLQRYHQMRHRLSRRTQVHHCNDTYELVYECLLVEEVDIGGNEVVVGVFQILEELLLSGYRDRDPCCQQCNHRDHHVHQYNEGT